jgi:2-phosphoglycerate kinase
LYARYTAAQTVAYYRARARQVWPGVQSFIEYALFDGDDLIIEGLHIDPALPDQFAVPADVDVSRAVRRIFLVREDRTALAASLKRGSGSNDWVLKGTRQEVTFARIAQMIVLYSVAIRADAQARGFPVINLDREFDAQLGAPSTCSSPETMVFISSRVIRQLAESGCGTRCSIRDAPTGAAG